MALPASAPKIMCTLSKPLMAEGSVGSIDTAFLSIDRVLVWPLSGETIYSDKVHLEKVDEGVLGFEVVPVDAAGMLDGAGNLVENWKYSLRVALVLDSGLTKTVDYEFQPKIADGATFDLDLVPQVGVVSDPPVTVSGQEVTINVTEATPEAIVAGMQSPEGEAFLKAAIAPGIGVPVQQFLLPGEVLDPSGVVDMSVIAQRAIDNVSIVFGPVQIIWPEGAFKLATQLTPRSGVGIRGAGQGRTVFDPQGDQSFLYGNIQTGSTWSGVWLEDMAFSDFTVDCSAQTFGGYTSFIKAFYMQHLRRCSWRRVTAIGSWASMFGVDFCVEVTFEDCAGYQSGRGGPTDPIGTGATFAFGVGYHEGESITLINCHAYQAGSSMLFLERLESRGATRQDGVVRVIGGGAHGCAVGVIDCGGSHILASGGFVIEDSTSCGWYVGPGGQSSVGGISGYLDPSVVIRGGLVGGYGSVSGGHGLVVAGSPSAGGYRVEARIEDNAGAGVYLMPGFALSAGGLTVDRARLHNNTGGGVVALGGLHAETAIAVTRSQITDCGVGVDLRTPTIGARIEDNTFASTGGQAIAIRLDPIYATSHLSVQGNVDLDTADFLVGDSAATDTISADNRHLATSPTPPGLLFSDPLRGGDVTGLPAAWTLLAGTGWTNVVWVRGTNGARPTITSGAPVSGWYIDAGQHGVRVQAKLMPASATNRRRGVMHSVDPATGNAVWAEFDNGSGVYRVAKRVGGTFTSVYATTVPATESHVVALERDSGTTTFRLLIDGTEVWSGAVTGVAETNYVGIIGAADGYARIADFAAWAH